MGSVAIAVDVAKQVFELAVSPSPGRVSDRLRLSPSQFECFGIDRLPCRVVVEACATSHYWDRPASLTRFRRDPHPAGLRAPGSPPRQDR